jgi:hypothetical protein
VAKTAHVVYRPELIATHPDATILDATNLDATNPDASLP